MTSTCYMCDQPETGREHVPPRCIFPEQRDIPGMDLRKNLISVPSCDVHNSQKSKDDEYLLLVLVSHFNNNKIAENQFRTKILRALQRRPKLVQIYMKERKKVLINDEHSFAFKIDRERIERELGNIARGLYYYEFQAKWTKRIVVHSPAMLALEGSNADFVNQVTQDMSTLTAFHFDGHPARGDNPEIFWYQIHIEGQTLVARMCFYQGLEVIVISNPRLKENF